MASNWSWKVEPSAGTGTRRLRGAWADAVGKARGQMCRVHRNGGSTYARYNALAGGTTSGLRCSVSSSHGVLMARPDASRPIAIAAGASKPDV